jgi:pilus assembly protein CpaE
MRAAFECTVVDLPRGMIVQYPHLAADLQVAVVVTELTLAAARDTIRILSWLKSNAPQCQVLTVACKAPGGGTLEISRKDFEGSIERRIDFVVPYDQKLAAQAAKLGKTLAEAGKGSKTVQPLAQLAERVVGASDAVAAAEDDADGAVKKKPKGGSLMARFDLKAMMPKRAQK